MNKKIPLFTAFLIIFFILLGNCKFIIFPEINMWSIDLPIYALIFIGAVYLAFVYNLDSKIKNGEEKEKVLKRIKIPLLFGGSILLSSILFIAFLILTDDGSGVNFLGAILLLYGAWFGVVSFSLIILILAVYILIRINRPLSFIFYLFILFLLFINIAQIYAIFSTEKEYKSTIIEEAKQFTSNFNATEITKADLPFSLNFWAEGTCPSSGNNNEYKIPEEYTLKSCTQGETGSHGGCEKCQMINIELYKEKKLGVEIPADEALTNDYVLDGYSPLMLKFIVGSREIVISHWNNQNIEQFCRYKEGTKLECGNGNGGAIASSNTASSAIFKEDQSNGIYLNINGTYYGPYEWFQGYKDRSLVLNNSRIFVYRQNGNNYVNVNDVIYGPYKGVGMITLTSGIWGFSYETEEEYLNEYAIINGKKYGPYSTITALGSSGDTFGFIYRYFYKDMPKDFYLKTNISILK